MEKIDFDLKLILNEKRIYPTESAKYLGIRASSGMSILMTLPLN